ncbi:MAG: hybrid sensor histidine kinase/response regulator [Alphaproteobacteria bacterium]|nr:MAG: hybrid sensor histidine kinase/response regulator [Alphaproteobacteria bacterium]
MRKRGWLLAGRVFFLTVFLIAGLLLQCVSERVLASPAETAVGRDALLLGDIIEVLEDRAHRLTIADVTRAPHRDRFRPLPSRNPYLGLSRSAWWGRFTLTNPSGDAVTRIVEFQHPILDRIEFYQPGTVAGHYTVKVAGDSVVGREVDIPGPLPAFVVDLPPLSASTFYVRISGDSSLSFAAKVWDPQMLIHHIRDGVDGNALFFGALLAAVFYSLSIYVVFREQSYLMFALLVAGMAVYQAESRGFLTAYLWPESTWISNLSILLAMALTIFATARFTSKFLRLERNAPNADALFRALQALGIVCSLLAFVDYHVTAYALIFGMVLGAIGALAVAIVLWKQGIEYARIYTVCWTFFCLSALVNAAQKLGLITVGMDLDSVFRVGFAATTILFAVAFSDRFRRLTRESELRHIQAKEAAEAASRAKSKFLATMSHELRTPLNAVIGFSEILAGESLGPLGNDKYREYATDIKESGSHLLCLVNDLLEISRIEAGHLELDEQVFEPLELVRRCVKLVETQAAEAGVRLTVCPSDALPALKGDESRTQQAIINLLSNAIKFTPEGGEVSLAVTAADDGKVRIAVSDTGIGIAEEDLGRILEPFAQIEPHLTRAYGGLGLGLAIAKSIIDLHGGWMDVVSAVGKGTTFTLTFPKERVIAA